MAEAELFELLQALNYGGRVTSSQLLSGALISGPPNILFYDVVTWLGSQLGSLLKLENRLTVDADYLNSSSMGSTLLEPLGFMVEMSSLLKELRCPIKQLTSGSIEERLFDVENKTRVIEYLMQELLSAKVIVSRKPQDTPLKIELVESTTAKELKEMLVSLSFSKPPDDITAQRLFREVEKRITALSQPLIPNEIVGELLFTGALTEKHWFQLERLHADFHAEYTNRRSLELKRTELTIQSFLWNDRFKQMAEKITNRYNERRRVILSEPVVNLADVLSSTIDLNVTEKTSSESVRKNTRSAVNKVRIGSVPDRGGRPSEQQPPPPEVPSWQKSDSSSRGGFRQSSARPNSNFQQSQNSGNQFSERNSNSFSRGGERPHFQQRSGNMAPRMQNPAGDNFAAYGNTVLSETNVYGQHRPNRRGRGGRGGFGGRGDFGGHRGYGGGGGFGGHGGFGGFGGHGQYAGQGY